MTHKMLVCAAGDVSMLFQLRRAQLERLSALERSADEVLAACQLALDEYRVCKHERIVFVPSHQRGLVVGRGGANIRLIQDKSGGIVMSQNVGGFLVLGRETAHLDHAEYLIRASITGRR